MPTNINLAQLRNDNNSTLDFGGAAPVIDIHANASIALPQVGVSSTAHYDINVWRGIAVGKAMPYQQATTINMEYLAAQTALSRVKAGTTPYWQQAIRRGIQLNAPWLRIHNRRGSALETWQQAQTARAENQSPWDITERLRQMGRLDWQRANALMSAYAGLWQYPPRHKAERELHWVKADQILESRALPYLNALPRRKFDKNIPWHDTVKILHLWPRPIIQVPPLPPLATPCLDPQRTRIAFSKPRIEAQTALQFNCWHVAPVANVTIPIRKVYIMLHDIEVKRLPDNIAIPASQVSIALDADSWAWSFNATLLGQAALDAVQPDSNGTPVTLAVGINNHIWHLLVEEWTENREFGKRGVSVRGRGLSALLSSPYQLPVSGIANTSAMTIQQAMTDLLPLGQGFNLNWQAGLADWLLPAGAWSYQNAAPINAIFDAAQQTGMIIVPGKASKTLNLQARYPHLPWEFAGATPNLTIPESAILTLQRRSQPHEQANAVYVHGSEVGGVFAQVKRALSAGDKLTATRQSALITHVDAARLLGGRTLAKYASQPSIKSLTLPLGGVYPLAEIGQLAAINLTTPERGIINAVQINAQMNSNNISVRQTLTIGEDTPNEWAKFMRLLPESPTLAGQLITNNGDGTSTLQLIDGGLLRVRGTGTASQWYYTKDGKIDGAAPVYSGATIIDV